jgi:hypothetical protein
MLIGLTSKTPGCGKSTVASYLMHKHNFTLVKFATVLKTMAMDFVIGAGVDPSRAWGYIYGDAKEEVIPELGVTGRYIQQTLGTEWGRKHIDPDIWLKLARRAIDCHMEAGRDIVIDDMRFRNEAFEVLAAGGVHWRIRRSLVEGIPLEKHESEGQIDHLKMIEIWNDGTLSDLYVEVNFALGYV